MNSSHAAQRNENSGRASTESLILADAFAEFISASSRLETFYGDLQKEVSQLGHELTERNAVLHASLSQSEEARRSLQQVMEALPCALVVAEESGSIHFINVEAARLLDHDGSLPLQNEFITLMFEAAAGQQERDFVFGTAGTQRAITMRCQFVRQDEHAAHNIGPVIAVLRDISRQHQIDEERLQRHKTRALAEVAAALAQDIRSPLASIELFTNLIAKEKGDPSRWIAHLRTNTRALADALNHAVQL